MSLIAAGFLLLSPSPRPDWASENLLPQEIISASDCLCAQFPGTYTIEWTTDTEDQRTIGFEAVGIPRAARSEAMKWATKSFEKSYGWPGVFYSLQEAETAKGLFFSKESNILLIGLGLPTQFVEDFILYAAPPLPEPGYAPTGETGWLEVVKRQQSLPQGQFLGFELLTVQYGLVTESWLCNGLEAHFLETLGIRPNRWGLIEDLENAKRCCKAINEKEVAAEPGLWLPWALVKYNGQ
jgi:hypothetical protein